MLKYIDFARNKIYIKKKNYKTLGLIVNFNLLKIPLEKKHHTYNIDTICYKLFIL